MTQEELDSLMDGDVDLDASAEEESASETPLEESEPENAGSWPPPKPTEDHQVVNQLDDVTRDSEEKATEIFDKLESISTLTMDIESTGNEQIELLKNNIDIFERLSLKFSEIESFKEALEENKKALEQAEGIVAKSQSATDEVMMTMDIMQYQDIHRQKIERVINVMRALSQYMNSLFDSRVDDGERVGSANHIAGDNTEDVVSGDDIEALIASFG